MARLGQCPQPQPLCGWSLWFAEHDGHNVAPISAKNVVPHELHVAFWISCVLCVVFIAIINAFGIKILLIQIY